MRRIHTALVQIESVSEFVARGGYSASNGHSFRPSPVANKGVVGPREVQHVGERTVRQDSAPCLKLALSGQSDVRFYVGYWG